MVICQLFQDGIRLPSFVFVIRVLGPPTKGIWWSLYYAKFGWNRCSSFDNMHVYRFREFGLKTHIHVPKLFLGGGLDPLNGEPCEQIPNRHILARVRVV